MSRNHLVASFVLLLCCQLSFGQTKVDTVSSFTVGESVPRRFYVGNGLDFAMLSTSVNTRPGKGTYLTIPRFTAMVNLGVTFHYDLNEHFGLMSGIGLRNMGFIDKVEDTTVKRRVYSLGIPLGIKVGDLRNRNFFFAGAGIDLPFHYKEKAFVKRSEKSITRDWFSERTPRVMPFIFAGHSWDPGITLKLQYYPGNFLNTDFLVRSSTGDPIYVYSDYKANLLLLSVGIDIHYGQYKMQEREYQQQKKEGPLNKLL